MKKNLLSLFCILFVVACNQQVTNTEKNKNPQSFVVENNPEAVGFDAERLQRIDTMLTKYIHDGVMPNALSFIARDGKIVHFASYGYKDAENKIPVKKDDIFRLASQTKAVTTVVLMTLFEENKFKLDDPVEKYLPMFANPKVYVSGSAEKGDLVTRPANKSITIRHLLTHTSGYSYQSFGEKLRVINYEEPIATKEAIERIARTPLMHDPGEKFTYGFSIDIAGYLAEVLTGKTLDILMKERIFDPLGMNDTYFYLPEEKQDRLVKCYQRTSLDSAYVLSRSKIDQIYPLAQDQLYHGGGAGLSGTIEDYAKFCQMILNKGEFNHKRILGRKTVELMSTNELFDIPGTYQFGLGFEVMSERGFIRSMISPGSLKWGGAYGTEYTIDPQENLIAIIYTNVMPWRHPGVFESYLISVYQALK